MPFGGLPFGARADNFGDVPVIINVAVTVGVGPICASEINDLLIDMFTDAHDTVGGVGPPCTSILVLQLPILCLTFDRAISSLPTAAAHRKPLAKKSKAYITNAS